MSAIEVQEKQQDNLNDHTTFVATPVGNPSITGGKKC